MALVVIQNIAPDPVNIGFLSAVRIMLQANCVSKLAEKFLRLWGELIGYKNGLNFYEFRYTQSMQDLSFEGIRITKHKSSVTCYFRLAIR